MNIAGELKRTFDLASLRHAASKKLSGSDWKAFQTIKHKHEDLRESEQRRFESEYDTRVSVAKKRLINQAGSTSKEFKPRWRADDLFDRAAIDQQARRNVQNKHYQLLASIDDMES